MISDKIYGPFTANDIGLHDRVELHPATDRWMRGDRYGTVVDGGRKYLRVRMDRSCQLIRVAPENIGAVLPKVR